MTLSDWLKQLKPYVLAWTRPRYFPFAVYGINYGATVSGAVFAGTIDVDLIVRRWAQAVQVVTTNDGSNYWTLTLRRIDTLATLATVSTAGLAPNTWLSLSATAIDVSMTPSMIGLDVRANKVGLPGALYAVGPAVWVE